MTNATLDLAATAPARPRPNDLWIPLSLTLLGLIPALAGIARLASLAPGGPTLPDAERFAHRPIVIAVHAAAGVVYSMLGAWQFSSAIRRARPALHRALGRLALPAGFVAALSGVGAMIAYDAAPTAGPAIHTMRIVVAVAMVAFLALGAAALVRRDFRSHGVWMMRAYALGIAPGTQALVLFPLAFGLGIDTELTFTVGMALGWTVNVAVAERILAQRTAPAVATQLAVVFDRYGGPEELHVARVPRPVAGPGQVVVRVEATSLNAVDRRMLRADPFLVRLMNGLFRPRRTRVLGADFAGVVVAVGRGVTRLAVGDRVFGDTSEEALGAQAELVVAREAAVAPLPQGLDAVGAAALPLAARTALQAVRERAHLRPGQRVLVYGAGGGVGGYLVQIAKAYGAHVTAVAGARSLEALRGLGADEVIDRARPETIGVGAYDVVFGVNGARPLTTHLASLVPGGVYVMVGGDGRQLWEALLFGAVRARLRGRRLEVLTMDAALVATDLAELRALVATGALRPLRIRTLPLARAAEAIAELEAGTVDGKIVLEVGSSLELR